MASNSALQNYQYNGFLEKKETCLAKTVTSSPIQLKIFRIKLVFHVTFRM